MQEREDERLCREAYEHHLRDVLGINGFSITKGDEPPDYWLSLDGKRYGVEVTTIFKKVEGGEKTIETVGYQRSIRDLASAIEGKAQNQAVLSGTYFLNFEGMPKYSPRKHKQNIINRAVDYIKDTFSQEIAEPLTLHAQQHHKITIIKTSSKKSHVFPGFMGSHAEWQIESVQNVIELLGEAMQTKMKKLSNQRVVSSGMILLVINRYQQFFQDDWNMFFEYWDSTSADFFHSIYVIQCEGEVIPVKEGAL